MVELGVKYVTSEPYHIPFSLEIGTSSIIDSTKVST